MGKQVLNINGTVKKTTDINFDDLVWLYRNYINKHNKVPITTDCVLKNNLPQMRIVQKLIKKQGVTYNDFMLMFGKVSHCRTESDNYDLFKNKYIKISNKNHKALTIKELINNDFGLPNAIWFVNHCPNKNVKTFDDFVQWCGFKSNKLKIDNKTVANKLIQLEKDLNRPITKSDISLNTCGFSMTAVNRIWGSLNNAKNELGLKETVCDNSKNIEFYKSRLDDTLEQIYNIENRKFISWKDIENDKYIGEHTEHRTYINAFKKQGLDFYSYIKSRGFTMLPSSAGHTYMFDDGENVKSTFEYDFSRFLKEELHCKYNTDYFRDVQYKTFSNIKSKINCDYLITIDNVNLYIEIAGMIYKKNNSDWRKTNYPSVRENKYRDTLILKESLLLRNNKLFLFSFPRDMLNGSYKYKVKNFINSVSI